MTSRARHRGRLAALIRTTNKCLSVITPSSGYDMEQPLAAPDFTLAARRGGTSGARADTRMVKWMGRGERVGEGKEGGGSYDRYQTFAAAHCLRVPQGTGKKTLPLIFLSACSILHACKYMEYNYSYRMNLLQQLCSFRDPIKTKTN